MGDGRLEKDYQLALASKLRASGLFVGVEMTMGAAGRADLVVQGSEDSKVAIVELKIDSAHVGIGQLFYYAAACEAQSHLVLAVPSTLIDRRLRAACERATVVLWSLHAGQDREPHIKEQKPKPFLDLMEAVEARAAEDLNGAFYTTADLMILLNLNREQVIAFAEYRRFRTVRVGMGGLLIAKHDLAESLEEGKRGRARSQPG